MPPRLINQETKDLQICLHCSLTEFIGNFASGVRSQVGPKGDISQACNVLEDVCGKFLNLYGKPQQGLAEFLIWVITALGVQGQVVSLEEAQRFGTLQQPMAPNLH